MQKRNKKQKRFIFKHTTPLANGSSKCLGSWHVIEFSAYIQDEWPTYICKKLNWIFVAHFICVVVLGTKI